MNRRSLLRGVAVAGAGVAVASEDAGAQTQLALAVAGDSTTLAPDASVTAVRLSLDVATSCRIRRHPRRSSSRSRPAPTI